MTRRIECGGHAASSFTTVFHCGLKVRAVFHCVLKVHALVHFVQEGTQLFFAVAQKYLSRHLAHEKTKRKAKQQQHHEQRTKF